MKKIYFLPVLLFIIILLSTTTLTQSYAARTIGQGLTNSINNMQNQASRSSTRQQNQLTNIINRGNTMITTRITSLNTLSTRIQNDSRLTSSEKTSLSNSIQTDIAGLTTLKTTIDAATDPTTARTDVKQIVTNYYIYVNFLPKTRLLIVLNNLQTVTANIQALVPQVQTLITTDQSQGKNVTQLQALLSDITTQLQTINTTLTNDINTVNNIQTSTQHPAAALTQVHSDITHIVRTDLAKIKSDFSQMRPLYRQITGKTMTTNPTVTP